jgi:hypothetical protein
VSNRIYPGANGQAFIRFQGSDAAMAVDVQGGVAAPVLAEAGITGLIEQQAVVKRPIVDSLYYDSSTVLSFTTTAAAVTANRLYVNPFLLTEDRYLERMAVRSSSGSGNIRLGIYRASEPSGSASPFPGALVVDLGSKAVSTDETFIADTANTFLAAGYYFLAAVFSGTPTMYQMNTYTASPLGIARDGFFSVNAHARVNHTFGALPDPIGAAAWNGGASPQIFIATLAEDPA